MTREAVVSGQFYPAEKDILLKDVTGMIPDGDKIVDAIGAIVPHAGYMYSGAVAGAVYSRLKSKTTYIVLSPNHTGYGAQFAISSESWHTPLGEVWIDGELVEAVMKNDSPLSLDEEAHREEHSVEVQLPFIQKTSPEAKIVPITMQYGNISELKVISDAIIFAVEDIGRKCVVLASSDMTHYECRESAKEKDALAIGKILDLDSEGLFDIVRNNNISMCGVVPVTVMLMCANRLKAKKAELVKYADSGDVTGDTDQVVGYAGVIIH